MSNAAQPDRPVLVTGATGNTGRALVDALTRRGAPVRAMVRSGADRGKLPAGVPAVVADFDDPESIAAALTGAERAYLVTPSSEQAEDQQRRFADQAAKAGLGHLVVLSQLGAEEGSPVRFLRYHAAVEQHVRDFGIPYTFLRPNLFFQGLLTVAGSIAAEGRLYAPIGDAKVSAVDVRDIAAVAVAVLTGQGHEGQTYEITGPEALSYHDVAATLSQVLGKPVRYIDVPPQAALESMRKAGMPEWNAAAVTEIYGAFATGAFAHTTNVMAQVTGRPPTRFEQFARDHAGLFR